MEWGAPCPNGVVSSSALALKTGFPHEQTKSASKPNKLRAGPERDMLLTKARQADTACHVNEWLNSPGFRPPR